MSPIELTSEHKSKLLEMCEALFPEYKNLRKNPWNHVKLTSREHLIAHIMLSRCFYGKLKARMIAPLFYFKNLKKNSHCPFFLIT